MTREIAAAWFAALDFAIPNQNPTPALRAQLAHAHATPARRLVSFDGIPSAVSSVEASGAAADVLPPSWGGQAGMRGIRQDGLVGVVEELWAWLADAVAHRIWVGRTDAARELLRRIDRGEVCAGCGCDAVALSGDMVTCSQCGHRVALRVLRSGQPTDAELAEVTKLDDP